MLKMDAWENAHRAREWGRWPSEHVVRFMSRTFSDVDRAKIRVLDIGAGVGAQSRFLLTEGFSVTAIDCSRAAIDRLELWAHGRIFRGYLDPIVGDIESVDFTPYLFDCLIDVCSLQHVREPLLVLGRATKWLKHGGRMISIWASDGHDKEIAEAISGHCWRLNSVDVAAHFAVFPIVDRQISVYTDRGRSIAHWIITAQKR